MTADDLKPLKLHWMPTLAGDVQAVLADEKVHFQMQEVAVVIAEDRYSAADGVEAVEVEYEELEAVVDPFEALKPGAPWVDPRAPDGVTILAPAGQAHPSQYPGLDTGDPLRAGALFDLQTDPGEQHDVAGAHPEIVARLRTLAAEFIKAASESRRPKTP